MLAGPLGSTFDPHSPEALAISSLFVQTLIVCGVIGVVVAGLVGTCVVRFRESKRPGEPVQHHGNTKLEITWTLIPLAVVIGLFVLTAHAMAASDPPASRDPDIVVVGHQWWWEARYASGTVTANELHMPVGKDLLVRVESTDVIHDFWVPQLGRKVDAIPGHPSTIWMQADAPGTYLGACAEFCGAEHAWMRIVVVADSPADFEAWDGHQREPAPGAATTTESARGETDFRAKTCINCHTIQGVGGTRVAPDLTHLAARKTLGAGVLANDPTSLARWLREPQVVKPASHMPDLNLTEGEVNDLTAYLDTLR
ncbi:MAG TPA: cytochrome c oxidase subunit II [Polyangiaceae bacterium]|nr:cytochrome c oxidase subunit II [Polyangiaceae bacterium]